MVGTTKIGSLAVPRRVLSASMPGAHLDEHFRARSDLTSMVVEGPHGPAAISRRDFYEAMTGRLGSGWSLHSSRSVAQLFDASFWERHHPLDAEADVVELGLQLIREGVQDGADELLVQFREGVGTVSAIDVLRHVAAAFEVQTTLLGHSEQRLHALIEANADAIVVTDRTGGIRLASPAYASLTGLASADEHGGEFVHQRIHPEDAGPWIGLFERAVAHHGEQLTAEVRFRRETGEWRWVAVAVRSLLDDSSVSGVVLNLRDTTEARNLRDDLRRRAETDPLTGLPNRAAFMRRVGDLLTAARTPTTGIVYLDLDRFKSVNDSLGHLAGDAVLVEVARRLRTNLRRGDLAARLGGDEFAVVVSATTSQDVHAAATRLEDALRQPIALDDELVVVNASVGVALHDTSSPATVEEVQAAVDELVRHADINMYSAKRSHLRAGRDQPHHDAAQEPLAQLLEQAIETEQLWMAYQPQFDLHTGCVVGIEALLRWTHPELGAIGPDRFVPVAESRGLMPEIGRFVARTAMATAAAWVHDGLLGPTAAMSINASATEVTDASYLDGILTAMEETGLPARHLEIELTETTIVDDTVRSRQVLDELRSQGIAIAIDDFGTGYASLLYLAEFAVDTIKIDRSFVDRLGTQNRAATIVEGIVSLAASLDARLVAEGVENEAQLAHLRRLGITNCQGYHFARPADAASTRLVLAETRHRHGLPQPSSRSSSHTTDSRWSAANSDGSVDQASV